MDDDDINDSVRNCKNLKHKFIGVFAANNFPKELKENSFLIVNSATAEKTGTHWLLFCQKDNQLLFADPLGQYFILQRCLSMNSIARRKSSNTAIVRESPNSKQKLQTMRTLLY